MVTALTRATDECHLVTIRNQPLPENWSITNIVEYTGGELTQIFDADTIQADMGTIKDKVLDYNVKATVNDKVVTLEYTKLG